MIEYKKRGRRRHGEVASYTEYDSKCGSYRVTKSDLMFGDLPPRWYALRVCGRRTIKISVHRTRPAAERAIAKFHRSRLKLRKLN